MDVAEFILRLVDRLSAPARKATGALSRLEKGLDSVRRSAAFGALDSAADSVLRGARKIAAAVTLIGVAAGAWVVKRTVEMAAFLERARMGLNALGGSAAAGGAAFSSAVQLAKDLGLEVDFALTSMLKLRAAQFSLGESQEIIRLGSDLRAVGTDAEGVKRAIIAITQIKAKGKLQSEELVGQLAEAGVATTLVYKHLAKQLGKTEGQIRALMQAGEITADQGIAAIKAAVLEKVGGSKLGEVGKRMAQETLGGMLDQLKAAPGMLFARVAMALKPAMARLKGSLKGVLGELGGADVTKIAQFVERVIDLLPAAVALAKEFSAGFGEGFGAVLDGMKSVAGPTEDTRRMMFELGKATAQFFGLVITGAKIAAQALVFFTTPLGQVVIGLGLGLLAIPKMVTAVILFAKGWAALAMAASGFMSVFGPLIGIIKVAAIAVGTFVAGIGLMPILIGAALLAAGFVLYKWWDEITLFFGRGWVAFQDFGAELVRGFAVGLLSGISALDSAITSLVDRVKGGVKSALGIASPSKVMAQLGAFAGEGFALGIEGEQGRVDQASRQSLTPGPALQGLAAGGGLGGGNVYLTINVSAGAAARAQTPQELARVIAREVQKVMRGMSESPAGA